MERGGYRRIQGTIPAFLTGNEENDHKPLSGQPASMFESQTFGHERRCLNHSTVAMSGNKEHELLSQH